MLSWAAGFVAEASLPKLSRALCGRLTYAPGTRTEIAGAAPAYRFPAFHQGGRSGGPVARRLVHAAVSFDRTLDGPLLLAEDRAPGLRYDGALVHPPTPALWG